MKYFLLIYLITILPLTELSAQILSDDLVIYYDFEETTGNILNDTAPDGVATNGSVVNTAASLNDDSFAGDTMADLTTDSVNLGLGSAMWSPLGGPFVSIDDTPDNILDINSPTTYTIFGDFASNQDWSINFWVRSVDGNRHFVLTSQDPAQGNADRSGIAVFHFSNGATRIMTEGGSATGIEPSLGWSGTGFTMLTMTFDRDGGTNSRGLFSLYQNGAFNASGNLFGGQTGAIGDVAMLLGSAVDFTRQEQFIFDEFAIWHRELSATDVQLIYNQNLAGNDLGSILALPVELSTFIID